jgi:hypothetical protein
MGKRVGILCTMCNLHFIGRRGAKTCSPRCRKRLERVVKGTALAAWPMETPPSKESSRLWR